MTSLELPRIQLPGEQETQSPVTKDSGYTFPPIVVMETAQRPSPPWKNDSFAPLRLGPVGKAKTLIDSLKPAPNYTTKDRSRSAATPGGVTLKYPRIIVRDAQGRTLDTFTTLQEAIYRASWTRKKKGEWPKTPLEWRLPKAPVPSKPDFTRAGPRAMTSLAFETPRLRRYPMTSLSDNVTSCSVHNNVGAQITMTTDVLVNVPTLEIPVDDVSFIAQSLQHLPNLPSFSFLRHSLLAGQSTYVQIVASLLLHQRHLRATDTRQNDWEFPGFCSGCKRAGFCYGCSKSSKPHIHEDIPARTGGGFRFWRPDRPRDPHSWKNPNNWRLPSTEQELQDIIRKYGGLAAYEKAAIAARRDVMTSEYEALNELMSQGGVSEGTRLERITTLGSYPTHVTIVSTDKFNDENDDEFIDDSLLGEETSMREGDEEYDDKNEEQAKMMREMMLRRMEKRRDRSRSHDSSRRRRIGVTSYKDDSASVTSQTLSARNVSATSAEGSVRIDTGFGDELEEGEGGTDDQGGEEEREGRRKVRLSVADSHYGNGTRGRLSTSVGTDGGRKTSQASRSSGSRKTSRLSFKDEAQEEEESEEARRKKETPKFFVVQKKTRRLTSGKDPFSTDRDLQLPKGPGFQLKMADRKQTQFVEFKGGDRTWQAPKAFEIKHEKKQHTKFWSPAPKKETDADKKRRRGQSKDRGLHRSKTDASTDSGLQDETPDLAPMSDDGKDTLDIDGQGDDQSTNDLQDDGAADGVSVAKTETEEDRKPKRREVVKKTRMERKRAETPPASPPRLPSPPAFIRRKTTTPSPSPTPSPKPPTPEVPLPDFEFPSVPDLPTFGEKEPHARKQKMKFAVEAPPPMKDVKKKRRPPPKVRIIPKNMYKQRKTRPAEAPVTQEELMNVQDPLDFLAKYCIINPDRLPFYEIVFETTVEDQDPIYSQDNDKEGDGQKHVEDQDKEEDGGKKKKGKSKKKKSPKEKEEKSLDNVIKADLLPANRGMDISKAGMTVEEQHLEKLIYTLDLLHDKVDKYSASLADLEERRTRLLAARARDLFPEVTSPDYVPKVKKKGKKGKKNKTPVEAAIKLRPDQITDDVIVARLDDKMLQELYQDCEIRNVDTEMNRLKEKIMDVQNRVEEIASEKLLADAFCMNHFFLRQGLTNNITSGGKPVTAEEAFKRQQSELYNKLHPDPDFEMNMDEVEGALQQINNHLLTEKEFAFLYNVLNLPGRSKINFRLFSIIAALSEKVTQLDPVIKHLMNNFNYNALDIKMEKCKELFDLLDADNMPRGGAKASSLAVELTAGGLRPENIRHVLHKFNRENRGVVDFLDFVTYVPLFVEIHKRIISDPLSQDSSL